MPELSSLKTMIRCGDLETSLEFYTSVLGLKVVEEWQQSNGTGRIMAFEGGAGGFLELIEVPGDADHYDPAFSAPVSNDKVELQIRTDSVDEWVDSLRDVWPTEGPVTRPWGNRYLWVRDPDGVRIALWDRV